MRLLPLRQIEDVLIRKLNPAGSIENEATHLGSSRTTLPSGRMHRSGTTRFKEITIHSTFQWKVAFGKLLASVRDSMESGADIDWENPKDPGIVLNACAEDIVKLWNDPTVKQLLQMHKIRLEDMSGL